MDYERILDRVRDLAAFEGPEDAERAVAAVVGVLGQRLLDDEAAALTADLPASLAQTLRRDGYAGDFDVEGFYDRVSRREGASPGFAREHAQVVCRVLGEELPEPARLRLQKHLPGPFAALFDRPAIPAPPEGAHHPPRREPPARETLATGRPGSRRPIAEARPVGAKRR